jgi:hypothetical protein
LGDASGPRCDRFAAQPIFVGFVPASHRYRGARLMCTVSYIGDDFNRRLPQHYPDYTKWVLPAPTSAPTRREFEALKKEMQELKELLKAAKRYDEQTGQPDCEQEDKIALLKRLAELVGVDLSEVFPTGDGA